MSKMDNLRAMREAKYAAAQKRSVGAPARPAARPPVAPPVTAAKPPAEPATEKPEPAADVVFGTDSAATEGLCGHRNMGGRTCTRERGHAAKSHRYS